VISHCTQELFEQLPANERGSLLTSLQVGPKFLGIWHQVLFRVETIFVHLWPFPLFARRSEQSRWGGWGFVCQDSIPPWWQRLEQICVWKLCCLYLFVTFGGLCQYMPFTAVKICSPNKEQQDCQASGPGTNCSTKNLSARKVAAGPRRVELAKV